MSSFMKLKFTKQSKQDLDDIWEYIARDNPSAADGFIDSLHGKCCMLAERPEIGKERPEIRLDIRSFPVGNYLIFYHLQDGIITIDRFLSGYRDIPNLFGD
ncbi:MAG: type II toxin-antitoxin system RelE/ParE family toxin [Deltaproteobacteria bacterium]|nr:type II toxin-antitoxin system RelE/ParE family toxin [Deltaproteobacteria bacterium]